MSKNQQGIIFDMDMVLVSSRTALLPAIEAACKARGLVVDLGDFMAFSGRNERHFLEHICLQNGKEYDPALLNEMLDGYERLAPTLVIGIDGAHEVVKAAKARGYRIAVASSANARKVAANLKVIGLVPEDFDAVVSADDVTEAKPSPAVFLTAAGRLGLAPGDCYVVEDSENGILAGKRAGAKVIAFTYVHPAHQLAALHPVAIIDRLDQLLATIERGQMPC